MYEPKGRRADNGYSGLANAIVYRAVCDYRLALKRQRNAKTVDDKYNAEYKLSELRVFFNSQWFGVLTTLDAQYLMQRMEQQMLERFKCEI